MRLQPRRFQGVRLSSDLTLCQKVTYDGLLAEAAPAHVGPLSLAVDLALGERWREQKGKQDHKDGFGPTASASRDEIPRIRAHIEVLCLSRDCFENIFLPRTLNLRGYRFLRK